jgi:hypothetical protein
MEVGTIGREGMAGLPVFWGADTSPLEAFPQVEGRALRLKTSTFKRLLAKPNGLHRVLHRYTQALFTQLSQSVACNRLHSLQQRCARWLPATADRLTQEIVETGCRIHMRVFMFRPLLTKYYQPQRGATSVDGRRFPDVPEASSDQSPFTRNPT